MKSTTGIPALDHAFLELFTSLGTRPHDRRRPNCSLTFLRSQRGKRSCKAHCRVKVQASKGDDRRLLDIFAAESEAKKSGFQSTYDPTPPNEPVEQVKCPFFSFSSASRRLGLFIVSEPSFIFLKFWAKRERIPSMNMSHFVSQFWVLKYADGRHQDFRLVAQRTHLTGANCPQGSAKYGKMLFTHGGHCFSRSG